MVESAEYADLRELGDARQEHKAEVGIGAFEYGIESLQNFAVVIEQFRVHFQHIEQGLVVFVNQHHRSASCFGVNGLHNLFEAPPIHFARSFRQMVFLLPSTQLFVKFIFQGSVTCKYDTIEVDVQHAVCVPILLQLINLQPLEQFLFPFEVSAQGRKEQTLSETAGPAQKVSLSFCGKGIDHVGFVHIDKTIVNDLFKSLYANWIFHGVISFISYKDTYLR